MDDTQGMIVDSTTVNVSLVTSTVTLVDIFTVLEDQHYTVSVSLTIINGSYTVTNTNSFGELTVKHSLCVHFIAMTNSSWYKSVIYLGSVAMAFINLGTALFGATFTSV